MVNASQAYLQDEANKHQSLFTQPFANLK